MNKKYAIIASLILLWMMHSFYKHTVLPMEMAGKYINNNTDITLEGPPPIAQGFDTLVLRKDNTFRCNTWGVGTYEVKNSFWQTDIRLSGSGIGVGSSVTRSLFGKPKILLNADWGWYYEKVE